ncbi:MAG: hypothetical protein MHPDNHAH_02187 [Anaerolineales bacterium]|nr:hypothetical protein [Anaerolineales bacterium]
MLRVGKLKIVGRVAPLVLLLVTTMGPWFIDSHPATEESCSPPFVWQGNGYCACLVSFAAAIGLAVKPGHSVLWLLLLPLALPFLSALLLLLRGERRSLRVCHLAAWGLVAIYSLFLFVGYWLRHPALILWGAGFCGMVAVAILVGEILAGKSPNLNESSFSVL